ncbi:O-antigen ligase family protein [bacterium]|nr:O-antigen ligase family protein [bacterium]
MMTMIREKYNQLNIAVLKVTKMKYFNEIYVAILAMITILGWKFSSNAGMIVMIILATISLLLTQDLKYVIPNCLYFIFIFSEGFKNDSFPIPLIVFGGIFAIIILFFSFKDGIHLKKMKSLIGLTGLALTTIIPIIWCRVPKENAVFYFLFFGNLGYLLLYMIMTNGMKENGLDLLVVSMSYLVVILACECGLKVYELRNTVDSILDLWYYLGWGLCNEAGIMICLSIPFAFYLLGKQENLWGMIFQNFKIIIGALGIILTMSRGSYLFGFAEIGIIYIVLMFFAKKARVYQNAFLVYFLAILLILICLRGRITNVLEGIMNTVFSDHFDDNGRMDLWKIGIDYWKSNPRNVIMGPGITCYLQYSMTQHGFVVTPMVFHSTLLETLAAGGIFGLIFLAIHLFEKYRNLKRTNTLLFVTVGIGFFIVDLYGLIDNTQHMYYFMLPLAIMLATFDQCIQDKTRELDVA